MRRMHVCVGSSDGFDVVVEEDNMDVEVRLQQRPAGGLAWTRLKTSKEANQTKVEKRLIMLGSKRLAES